MAAGEVFYQCFQEQSLPCSFFPLLFWPGIIGKFMIYLPTVLILTGSLSDCCLSHQPGFATSFMKPEYHPDPVPKSAVFKSKPYGSSLYSVYYFICSVNTD
jgi:hypothetical protein